MFYCCRNFIVFSERKRARTESQPDNQKQSRSQSGQRAQQGNQGDQGAPAKRLKQNPDTQQQIANSAPGKSTLRSILNSSPSPSLQQSLLSTTPQTQHFNLSSSSIWPQFSNAPFSYLPARIGRPGGSTRRGLRQTLVERSLARGIAGKERLSVHLRQSLLCDRGEERELLTYQDITEDLQVGGRIVLVTSQFEQYVVLLPAKTVYFVCTRQSIYRCQHKHENTCHKLLC